LLFAAGGAFENMQEEIIALVPVLLLLARRMGWDPLTAAAMSVGAAAVGSSFSPYNPFQVLIAQHVAQLEQGSAWQVRLAFLALALAVWIFATLRYARRVRHTSAEAHAAGAVDETVATPERESATGGARAAVILAIVAATFAVFVWSVTTLHWDFDRL